MKETCHNKGGSRDQPDKTVVSEWLRGVSPRVGVQVGMR